MRAFHSNDSLEFNREEITKAASKFISLDLRPFNALECPGLQELVMAGVKLGQKYPTMTFDEFKQIFPSRNTVKKMVSAEAESAKNAIKELFEKSKKNGDLDGPLHISNVYGNDSLYGWSKKTRWFKKELFSIWEK